MLLLVPGGQREPAGPGLQLSQQKVVSVCSIRVTDRGGRICSPGLSLEKVTKWTGMGDSAKTQRKAENVSLASFC